MQCYYINNDKNILLIHNQIYFVIILAIKVS